MPIYGVGPYVIAPIVAVTVISIFMSFYNLIPCYILKPLDWLFVILGIVLICEGILFYFAAVKLTDINERIKNNELVVDGVYAIVRHPIYSAFLHITTGLIFIFQNIYLFVLPVIFWIVLSIVVGQTEEKWLYEKFGQDYWYYSQEVNGFIPSLTVNTRRP